MFVVSAESLAVDNTQFLSFSGESLQAGRKLWLENCKGCHAYGTAGAPIPMHANDWRPRVIKSREVLYDHAINGFFGPDDTMMPERGGNPDLTDAQVKLAVDYMVTLARHYIDQQSN
jgi:cytochrome c5